MDKDLILREIFETMALHNSGTAGSAKFLLKETEYDVCSSCALQIAATKEDIGALEEGVLYPYTDEQQQMVLTDLNRVKPELALEYDQVPLTDPRLDYCDQKYYLLPVTLQEPGFWILEHDAAAGVFKHEGSIPFGSAKNMKALNMMAYCMPRYIGGVLKAHGAKLSDLDGCIMCKRFANVAALALTGDTGFLYAAMAGMPVQNKEYQNINSGGTLYMCDGLQEFTVQASRGPVKFYKYTKLMKGNKMLKLQNPVPLRSAEIAGNAAASGLVTVAQPTDSEINNAVAAAAPLRNAKYGLSGSGIVAKPRKLAVPAAAQPEPQPEPQQDEPVQQEQPQVEEPATAQEEHVQQQQVQETEQEPVQQETAELQEKQKAKRKTKAATTAGGFDFFGVLEYLGSPVQGIRVEELDAVLSEIRSLRDVQITAARRAANLTTEICKISADGLQTLADLQAVLNRK